MAKFSRQTWYWLAGIGGGVLLVAIASFLILSLYNPLVLINKISGQDVIGYLEWQRIDVIKGEDLPSFSFISKLNSKLPCKLFECDFWGPESALVLRKRNDVVVPEIYLYQPLAPALNDTWNKVVDRNNKMLWGEYEFELRWFDDIAVISADPLTTVAKINTVAEMPWVRESKISSWSQGWGTGYCSLTCLNWFNGEFSDTSNLALMPAFLSSTVRFAALTLYPGLPFQMEYQLFFTDQYHHPITNKSVFRDITLAESDIAAFSGEDLNNKLRMLEGEAQNTGLWQTVQSLWSTAPTGEAWWNILLSLGNYPYTVYLNKESVQSRLELSVTNAEKTKWRANLEKNVAQYAAILFPKRVSLKLPDGTSGAEYVKNNDLITEWKKENDIDTLFVHSQDGNKVFRLYVQDLDNKLVLSLASPIRIASTQATCFQSTEKVEEFSVYHLPTWPMYLWQEVSDSSTQVVRGNIYFDNHEHNC